MEVRLAESLGFCFGVRRAIEMAEENPGSQTYGPLIHNPDEIKRLKEDFDVWTTNRPEDLAVGRKVIIRTHGIPKDRLAQLDREGYEYVDATCPFVKKPQEICARMSAQGYDIVIFGDASHPEVQGVVSYADGPTYVVQSPSELSSIKLKSKIAVISQTTRKFQEFMAIVEYLIARYPEVAVFNTICNATFDNQDAARELAREVDVMVVVGGKNSSNTKQLLAIASEICPDSYLVERAVDLDPSWFVNKQLCGVTAGASTPKWVIDEVVEAIKRF
ncbi:MAG: 4-hydroxy-3-methylbut-2-enyl diphosphate reductase [Campylobacterales bacterium]